MEQNPPDNANAVNRLVIRLAAEKKKGIMALCLIAMMVFMWVRVLGNKKPQGAEAALTTRKITADNASKSALNISFVELPNVEGRNDVLTRDFFAVGNWRDFKEGKRGLLVDIGEGGTDESSSKEKLSRIIEKIKLEAIGLGESPQAFINDRLLSAGDKLPIRDGSNMYECEIVSIEDNKVLIRCGETEITLKLAQETEANK